MLAPVNSYVGTCYLLC